MEDMEKVTKDLAEAGVNAKVHEDVNTKVLTEVCGGSRDYGEVNPKVYAKVCPDPNYMLYGSSLAA